MPAKQRKRLFNNATARMAGVAFSGVCLLLAVPLGQIAHAQVAVQFDGSGEKEDKQSTLLQPPRELVRKLRRAEKGIEAGEFAEAVSDLGDILDSGENEDYFLPTESEKEPAVSFKLAAQRLLGKMKPEGRRLYELQYGPPARTLLETAVKEGDADKLSDVMRRYFHTQAGYEAAMLLGRNQLDQDRPLAAAFLFSRLAETPVAADQFNPELSLLLAAAWKNGGQEDKATQVLLELKKKTPGLKLQAGGIEIELFTEDAQALPWLAKILGEGRDRLSPLQHQWTMFRGDPSRNGRNPGAEPVMLSRWSIPTVFDMREDISVATLHKQYMTRGVAALPALQPLGVSNVVLMRSPRLLMAINLESGKRLWYYPAFGDDKKADQYATLGRSNNQRDTNNPAAEFLQQRIWEDAPFGEISSDGARVYLLDNLGKALTGNYGGGGRMIVIGANGRRQQDPDAPTSSNRLVALSLASQGKTVWSLGGRGDMAEPRLEGAFYLGPPVPLDGQLFVMAEIKGEVSLVVLDAKTGKLQWKQQVSHVDAQTIELHSGRRLAGASPSIANGVLVCSTGAGVVVGIDLVSHSLMWAHRYSAADSPQNQARFFGGGAFAVPAKPLGSRWADSTVTITNGVAIVPSVDGDKLFALDLMTGKELWSQPREQNLYVACVHEGNVVLVGKEKVSAFKLQTGAAAWAPLPVSSSNHLTSGRGFYNGKNYFLPTTAPELLKIDLKAGQIVGHTKTDTILGNLIGYKDQIVSQGIDKLQTFYQLDSLRETVAKRLTTNGDDAWALSRSAWIQLHDGKPEEAIVTLRKVYRLQPDEPTRSLLLDTLMQSLRTDFIGRQNLIAEIEGLIDQPARRGELMRVMARGWHKAGQLEKALDSYLKLFDLESSGAQLASASDDYPDLEKMDELLLARRDRWVQAQINDLLQSAAPAQREKLKQIVQDRLAAAKNDKAHLQRLIAFFGNQSDAAQARLKLAAELLASAEIGKNELLQTELLLADLRESDDEDIASQAFELTAQVQVKAKRGEEAGTLYATIAARWPDRVIAHGKTGKQLAEAALKQANDEKLAEFSIRQLRWPEGKHEARLTVGHPPSLAFQRLHTVDIREARGPAPSGQMVMIEPQALCLVVRDGFGREQSRFALQNQGQPLYSSAFRLAHGKSEGHLLIACVGNEIIAFNTLFGNAQQQGILWRQSLASSTGNQHQTIAANINGFNEVRLTPQSRSLPTPWGTVRQVVTDSSGRPLGNIGPITAEGVVIQIPNELICLDPISGKVIWSRRGIKPGATLLGDRQTLIAIEPNSQKAKLIRMADGQLLGERPVPAEDRRWMIQGHCILTWDDLPEDGRKLKMVDILSEKVLWSYDFDSSSRGSFTDDNQFVGIMQQDGKFALISLADGAKRIDTQLLPEKNLTGVNVIKNSNRFLLVTNNPATNITADANIQAAPPGLQTPIIFGRMYAFDSTSGNSLWQTPAAIENYGLPLDQPTNLPVLWFIRHITPMSSPNVRRTFTSVLAVDTRDGRALYSNNEIPVQTNTFRVEGNPEEASVSLYVPGNTIAIKYGNDPVPPEPPVQTGGAASKAEPPIGKSLSGKGAQIQPQPGVPGGGQMQIIQPNGARVIIQGQGRVIIKGNNIQVLPVQPAQDEAPPEQPAQDTPEKRKVAPQQQPPAKQVPAKEAPAKNAPAKNAPAKDAPAKDAPAKDAPAKQSAGKVQGANNAVPAQGVPLKAVNGLQNAVEPMRPADPKRLADPSQVAPPQQ